jgi:hypothetical protein
MLCSINGCLSQIKMDLSAVFFDPRLNDMNMTSMCFLQSPAQISYESSSQNNMQNTSCENFDFYCYLKDNGNIYKST